MEKYGIAEEDLIQNLRDEEGRLMAKMASYMSSPIKTAEEEQSYSEIQSRLQHIRQKITDYDLKKKD